MCYTVLLSTDCPDDLFSQNGDGICFQPADGQSVQEAAMPYARNYDVVGDGSDGSHGGCGCCFSLYGDGAFAEYGFHEPEIASLEMLERSPMRETLHLQEVIRRLVRQGWRVQLATVWAENWGGLPQGAEMVAMAGLNPLHFALYENVRFEFV
ncbi:hypothetical protein H9Q10_08740 [Eikenella sp. S3360]|uniref:Uncharacterized protein n=1 Tax=Eikenella glucosivorans TaxID=2766967 RepID=A0ABS0NBQ0_9NEIS|nr:hypothetical protein [Eikenella glucosivorans]MBH5329753.1 hypothetical protein [Eikenella glucosivorans]